ncbi:MAG TPA: hypothetical protein VM145_06245 [Sphingomicrobium sp.]|nr:hypothetical protein [Sphingomicrobium sp.]
MNWKRQGLYLLVIALAVGPVYVPQLLAFPYSARVAGHRVWSEAPIPPRLGTLIHDADRRAAASAIATATRDQPIFLTDGGWRWTWLTLQMRSAFAITRPISEAIVVNRSDPERDLVMTKRDIAAQTSLRRVLAHEMTHGAIRAHFGVMADSRYPAWLREGYCDFISGGTSLTDAGAAQLLARRQQHPALVYWQGEKRVAAELKRNGGSVAALFAAHRIW